MGTDPDTDPLAGIEADYPGCVVTRFLTIAEVITADGETFLTTHGSPGLSPWDTVGMLTHALAQEQAAITDAYLRRQTEEE